MKTIRRTNLLWGVVLLALAGALMARAFGMIPASIYDLLARAWPALLVLAGLAMFLRARVPLGGLIAVVLCAALVGGLAVSAYSTRAGQQRSDNQQVINQPIGDDVPLLRVRVQTLSTDVELLPARDRVVTGEFVGSTESDIQVGYLQESDSSATLTITEVQKNAFPMLEAVGRGTLRLELPPNIPLDVEFGGTNGAVTLNMSGLGLERLNVNLAQGSAAVTLPVYNPLLSEDDDLLGTLAVNSGDINVFVPRDVAARLELNRGASGIVPQYDDTVYNYLVGDVLEAKGIEDAPNVVRYAITAPRGRIRVTLPPE